MVHIPLINNVIALERALESEEDRRRNHRSEPYVNYLTAPQSCRRERKSIFRIFQHRGESQAPADFDKAGRFYLPHTG